MGLSFFKISLLPSAAFSCAFRWMLFDLGVISVLRICDALGMDKS